MAIVYVRTGLVPLSVRYNAALIQYGGARGHGPLGSAAAYSVPLGYALVQCRALLAAPPPQMFHSILSQATVLRRHRDRSKSILGTLELELDLSKPNAEYAPEYRRRPP